MDLWRFISDKLNAGIDIELLYVLESEGSSPGRQGFKMAVAADGTFCGTIGGGIMEHKLVEKVKSRLQQNESGVLLMRQHHDKEHANDQSGMICSGNQLNAFIPLTSADKETIEKIIEAEVESIQLSPKGLQLIHGAATGLQFNSEKDWLYSEPVIQQPVIHIIGGGHVAFALSELMHFLGFYIKLYDDRPGLNTIAANSFACEKYIVNYDSIDNYFIDVENEYAVIMTIGYRTDKTVLKQLLEKSFFYLGLLGSQHKIETLFKELKAEGVTEELLNKIFSPIGLNINSKTTKEIAVSIAAEIVREKNKKLPTVRNR
jgi:xanthine dehydrogenase accessory factor